MFQNQLPQERTILKPNLIINMFTQHKCVPTLLADSALGLNAINTLFSS